ncbi:polysaccharide deacetylase family protein [Saprospiraceae bacterium]|nr:polysaccharide deacetylase family protein [Bacteroidota bacterium]MDB4728116.1 polysaccharide deacetylase family protein [Saprospiraceae bacterium]MDF1863856.1 polysaccharide deacetylase family protein [Saprospiraceae bacterium]
MNLKNTFKNVLGLPAQLLPLKFWINLTGQNLFLPFYHSIGEVENLPHIRHLYRPRTEKEFEKDLEFLLKNYTPIGIEKLATSIENQGYIKKPSFFLSFDDGLSEVYHIAAPILKKKGVPATIFLNSAFVDNQALFFRYKASLLLDFLEKNPSRVKQIFRDSRAIPDLSFITFELRVLLDEFAKEVNFSFKDFLKKRKPYLTSKQIESLKNDGFTFGGHSVNHPLYENLDLNDQLSQTEKSIFFTNKRTKSNMSAFAFPFTDHGVSDEFFRHAKSKQIFDISFGTAGLKIDEFPFHFQRFPMEGTGLGASQLIKGEYFYYALKRLIGKHKIKRN